MRHIILSLIAAAIAVTSWGAPVDPQEARAIANDFFNSAPAICSGQRRAVRADVGTSSSDETSQPYYVFNAEDGQGFVIVAGDTRAQSILGYADSGNFDARKLPPPIAMVII